MSATSQAVGAPELATAQAVAQPKRPRSNPFTNLRLHVANVYRLMIKELRGIRSDPMCTSYRSIRTRARSRLSS